LAITFQNICFVCRPKKLTFFRLFFNLFRTKFTKSDLQNLPHRKEKIESFLLEFSTTYICMQGCQIFLGPKYQNGEKYTKLPQNIPNGHKIDQLVIKYIKIFHSKTLQNYPNWDFWLENKPSGNPVCIFVETRFCKNAPLPHNFLIALIFIDF
jgi:hypothetical protein